MEDVRTHSAEASAFAKKLYRTIGMALMVIGGLLSITLIGIFLGVPLIVIGAFVYFIVPSLIGPYEAALLDPSGKTAEPPAA